MAIFIALIFQVLFVFFAMIVNIGLIVHDKINLQNSVDLAAYYGAQRQAEMLNAIAHQNYEIRQAWKLLSWRIRVLGDLGYQGHPLQQKNITGAFQDVGAYTDTNGRSLRPPSVCINHSMWGMEQNVCYHTDIRIPELPKYKVINIFFPGNYAASILVDLLREKASRDAQQTGPLNFNMALRWARAYRVQVSKSKEAIRMYADALSKDPTDFRDIYGKSAKQGVLKTLANNLTRANAKALYDDGEQESFRFYNSLGMVGDRKKWLNEVPIYPIIFYTDLVKNGGGFIGQMKPINGQGKENRPQFSPNPSDDDDVFRNEPTDPNNLFHSVYGVEKNPWAMAYVAVYAQTKPRKPYLPFGEPITLKAKAYAKPFGGRIGPWFYRKWPQGSQRSAGNASDMIDPLSPIPMDPSGTMNYSNAIKDMGVPNYSRYPGDALGLNSRAALGLFRETFNASYHGGKKILPGYYSGTPTDGDGLAMANVRIPEFAAYNQPLPKLGYKGPWIREFEVAAVAPDLFDVTYYSIDRDSYRNYSKPSVGGKLLAEVPLDIGSIANGEAGVRNIADQINIAVDYMKNALSFWMIKDPNHLLTGWAPSGAYQYAFPKDVFGECFTQSSDSHPVPGKCARGGRVGYSVKIISEDYLRSSNLPLGGDGATGPIINPPPNNF